MKTRKTIEIKCVNDLEVISKAQDLLLRAVEKQPYCKHIVTVTLSNGASLELFAIPNYSKSIA